MEYFEASPGEHKRGNANFCSRSCGSQLHQYKKSEEREPNVKCALCNTAFYKNESKKKISKSGLYFCSRKCKDKAQRIGGIKEIQPPHYGEGVSRYREIAFSAHPHKCNRCEWDQYIAVLQVHHRDRDRENADPKNLEILCPTCHLVDHFLAKDGLFG